MQIKGKNIVITGATSGIGKTLTMKLFEEGANVAFCGRSQYKMSSLLLDLNSKSNKRYYEVFDATDYKRVKTFVKNAISALGSIDILINCAGANTSRSTVGDTDISDLEYMLKVNLMSPFVFMKETYQQSMLEHRNGMIINVLSTVCAFSNEGIGAYTASKSGFDALTNVFRKEVRETGIKICSIYPGGVDTPFREADRPQYLNPESVADSISFMLKQDANACVDELIIRPMIEKNYS